MGKSNKQSQLQLYPRMPNGPSLAHESLFPPPSSPFDDEMLIEVTNLAFRRCSLKKSGTEKAFPHSPQRLVEMCIEHLRTRSDPIIGSFFVNQCDMDDLFELDAVSHEMQRHRMTIGAFYQYLILELMRKRWHVFDAYHEGDIMADIDTPGFAPGLRLYISVKKSIDTVGGQDIGGVVDRLESMAKQEKNLNRPYLCVFCIATPSAGRLLSYQEDRHFRYKKDKSNYSLNCEFWGPGFIFPYITGRSARDVYRIGIKQVAEYLPFRTLKYRRECSVLLKEKLNEQGLIGADGKLDSEKFLNFCCVHK